MKKIALVVALAALSLVACGGSKGSDKGTEAAKTGENGGTLIMATNAEFPPMNTMREKIL